MKVLLFAAALMVIVAGCSSPKEAALQSAAGKNVNLDGYVMVGEMETATAETGTPTGKLIIGRVTYKSRRVGIPADQTVPTTGYFKSTKTKSIFGTEEHIIEYDFTAGSDEQAKAALKALEKKRKEAQKEVDKKDENN